MKVIKTLVGSVVTFLFIVLTITLPQTNRYPWPNPPIAERLGPAVGDALSFLLVSIVCTLGISLVFWIPLWFAVGWVVFEIVGWLSKALKGKPTTKDAASWPRDKQALVSYIKKREQQTVINYIKKARSKGVSDDQISLDLQAGGWVVEDEINWAFAALK